ncbi:hypothetical protein [uncultured Rikenella sp.]|uniref:hypothetical protein n=1 Tax=uncultured Rikenella sp. TaxID=368003 RepID=UPI0025E55C2C|nr:hypothetical protein [uncultured Rikenella sp.]
MKRNRFLIFVFSFFVFCVGRAMGQGKVVISHPLYPFCKYAGDTVAYLTQNFDGGADDLFYEQPLSRFLKALDPKMPIRTFVPHYVSLNQGLGIVAFFCFPYTHEELQRFADEGKVIDGIGLTFDELLSKDYESELYNYFLSLGVQQVHCWTPEIEQKIGHLTFIQGSVQKVDIKRFMKPRP